LPRWYVGIQSRSDRVFMSCSYVIRIVLISDRRCRGYRLQPASRSLRFAGEYGHDYVFDRNTIGECLVEHDRRQSEVLSVRKDKSSKEHALVNTLLTKVWLTYLTRKEVLRRVKGGTFSGFIIITHRRASVRRSRACCLTSHAGILPLYIQY
jgi:hypothetical protein